MYQQTSQETQEIIAHTLSVSQNEGPMWIVELDPRGWTFCVDKRLQAYESALLSVKNICS